MRLELYVNGDLVKSVPVLKALFANRKDYTPQKNFERKEKRLNKCIELFKKSYSFEISVAKRWEIYFVV